MDEEPSRAERDPIVRFDRWFAEAVACAEIRYPSAASLATVDEAGQPDCRVVLAERVGAEGFVFLTDRRSPKARALTARPDAVLLYYWPPLERQVRIRGRVDEADASTADRAFEERPRPSRITAWASVQSRPFDRWRTLEAAYAEAEARLAEIDRIPRPDDWVAFRLQPTEIELWRAGARRMHRRRRFRRTADGIWTASLLEP